MRSRPSLRSRERARQKTKWSTQRPRRRNVVGWTYLRRLWLPPLRSSLRNSRNKFRAETLTATRTQRDALSHLLPPQPCRGDVRTLADRLELEPDHRLDHPLALGKRAETAVGRGDHPFAVADRSDRLLDPPRHHLGMLDEVRGGFDHARNEQHVRRQRMLFQRGVFMGVARIGELDG